MENVSVVGLGYVGCVTAACLAELGHRVIGVDRDDFKVRSVNEGRAPFFEPGLDELVRKHAASGRLAATLQLDDALQVSDIALICVGTPSDRNGNLNLEQLRRVSSEIAAHLGRRTHPLVVAVRSTVWPGSSEEIFRDLLSSSPLVRMVSNPEFLREGNAVRDFFEPSLIVVGGEDENAVRRVAGLYAGLPVEPALVSLRAAEAVKYACNAFHALKIAFANEIGSLCRRLDISASEVMDVVCRDSKLNLSAAYLRPGFAFGGSCLPKDLRALTWRAARLDLKLPLLESVLASNDEHLRRAVDAALELEGRLGIFGLAFKENTDDVRESPVVALIERLIGKGRDVRIWDPRIRLGGIYGSNERFLLAAIPHIGKLLVTSLQALLAESDHLILAQTPSPQQLEALHASGKPILDLTSMG